MSEAHCAKFRTSVEAGAMRCAYCALRVSPLDMSDLARPAKRGKRGRCVAAAISATVLGGYIQPTQGDFGLTSPGGT
jgi:hypothetical protein